MLVYIWREPLPLATKVAWELKEKTLGQSDPTFFKNQD
jgi:hypothetical protein